MLCSLAAKLLGVAYMNRYLSWNLAAPDTVGVYRPLGISLANGSGYRLHGDFADATRVAPGFPAYLASVYRLFGTDVPVPVLGGLNAVLRSLTTFLVYVLALRAFGPSTAFFAAAVHAIDPWEAFWSAFVLKESLAVLLAMAAIVVMAGAIERRSPAAGFGAGVLIALAGLTRYASIGLLPWALALIGARAVSRRVDWGDAARIAAALTLGALIGLAPWLIRNRSTIGAAVVYAQPGYYLWVSNGPGTEKTIDTWGYSGLSTPDPSAARVIAGTHHGVIDRDRAFFIAALSHMLARPFDVALLAAGRFVNMWRPTFAGASRANLSILGGWSTLFAIAVIAGFVLSLRTAPVSRDSLWIVYGFVLFYFVLHAAFWSEIRYRQYVTPLMCVFAGLAVRRALTFSTTLEPRNT